MELISGVHTFQIGALDSTSAKNDFAKFLEKLSQRTDVIVDDPEKFSFDSSLGGYAKEVERSNNKYLLVINGDNTRFEIRHKQLSNPDFEDEDVKEIAKTAMEIFQ